MTSAALKKQFDNYLPMLSPQQQTLLLEMAKSFLIVNIGTKRITRKQYNMELDEAVARIEKGNFITHKNAIKELSKGSARIKM